MRIGVACALALADAGECACSSREGNSAAVAASACAGVQGPAVKPGNSGQVEGAVTKGLDPELASAIIAAMRMAMAQWCAP
jgi:hypothetical protein